MLFQSYECVALHLFVNWSVLAIYVNIFGQETTIIFFVYRFDCNNEASPQSTLFMDYMDIIVDFASSRIVAGWSIHSRPVIVRKGRLSHIYSCSSRRAMWLNWGSSVSRQNMPDLCDVYANKKG